MATTVSASAVPAGLVMAEGFDRELEELKTFLQAWTAAGNNEVKPLLEWQFLGRSKYFRPVTLFACHTAMSEAPVGMPTIRAAAAIEMVHNVSLIVEPKNQVRHIHWLALLSLQRIPLEGSSHGQADRPELPGWSTVA